MSVIDEFSAGKLIVAVQENLPSLLTIGNISNVPQIRVGVKRCGCCLTVGVSVVLLLFAP